MYSSVHNFNKCSVSNFSEISSRDSKFNTLNKFYKDFKKLEDVKSQTNETKQKKITVLKNSSVLYDMLIKIYRKEYIIRFLKVKMKTGGKNMIIRT